jgi:ATP-binding cassette subfamily B protein
LFHEFQNPHDLYGILVTWSGESLPTRKYIFSMTVAEYVVPHAFQTNRSSPLRWVISHVSRHWWLVVMATVGALGNAILASLVPVLVGEGFNILNGDLQNLSELGRIALLIVGSQILRGMLQLSRNFGSEWLGQSVERDVRSELYANLLGKSMTFHNLQPVGDTMARATNDVRELNLMFNPGFNLVIGSANFLIVPLIWSYSYHPSLILVPVLFIIGYILALGHFLRELEPISDSIRRTFGIMNTRLSEGIDGIEVVKGASREREEVGRFEENARAYRDAFVHQGNIQARYIPLLLIGLTIAGAFLHAMLLYKQGAIDLGQVVAYVSLIQLFRFPTFVSLFAYSQVSLGMASARRIYQLLEQKTALDHNPVGLAKEIKGEIEFRGVTFGHEGGDHILEDISFAVQQGQTVAVVGQTGTGKTTISKLINRTYDANSGQVLIDGVDVRKWNLEVLRRQISIIEQDVFLFSRTLADNIAFGCPGASQEEIESAARAAQAHDFIVAFQEGYQTVVGERGVTLSGGQRQRIALARAFLTDPKILILDDATSSIDSSTEDQIQRAIFRAAKGRTTVIITHRLSQIRWADLIIVLRSGKVAAIGTHDDLMDSSPSYRNIFTRYGGD